MNVRIARDGVEIGECDWEDLEQLVNEGQVLRTDHYWYEGMPDWRLLDDLIGLEGSEPKPVAPLLDYVEWDSGEPIAPRPVLRSPSITAVAIGCAVVVIAITAFYLVVIFRGNRSEIPRAVTDATTVLERTDVGLRSKATSDLATRLSKLPTVAASPSNAFYDSLSIEFPNPPASLTAAIRGTETVVDPKTRNTISRADFIVTADFREGKWLFKYYHAMVNDLANDTATEIDRDDQYPIPPAIVSLLGLQVKSD